MTLAGRVPVARRADRRAGQARIRGARRRSPPGEARCASIAPRRRRAPPACRTRAMARSAPRRTRAASRRSCRSPDEEARRMTRSPAWHAGWRRAGSAAMARPAPSARSPCRPSASCRRLPCRSRPRSGSSTARRAAGASAHASTPLGRRRRLVLGLRLFRRRTVVARRGFPRRGRSVRLGAAVRRSRPAGAARVLSRPGFRRSRGFLAARTPRGIFAFAFGLTVERMAARPLFTGFPWNTLGMALGQNLLAHAGRLAGRACTA